jgi:Abnormal spindle-like microcephaly-assoc'd, ASPM-SPD-2-Hydin
MQSVRREPMSRYCQALVIIAVAVLTGCGGGAPSPNNSPSGSGNNASGTLSVSAAAIDFGNVALGGNATKTEKVTAAKSAVTISSANWNGDGFSIGGITFPVTVMAGQSASFTVTFAPQRSGTASGGISFLSNAANSPTAESFSGVGTQMGPSPQHSVSLSWSPSPSTVIGYNVYRGTSSGGPYSTKLTPAPQAGTNMVDGTVMSGTTYYYVATSVDQHNVESIYSNQLTAAVP